MNEVDKPQVHDLLQIDPALPISGCVAEPTWVKKTLLGYPWVVVLRAQTLFHRIAIGVRGAARSERWGAFCDGSQVRTIVRPEQLLDGFELASGRGVTSEASGLDLVLRAPQRIPVDPWRVES